jgi:hypothetical protein
MWRDRNFNLDVETCNNSLQALQIGIEPSSTNAASMNLNEVVRPDGTKQARESAQALMPWRLVSLGFLSLSCPQANH